MGLLDRLRRSGRRVAMIGLDGTPYTYMQSLIERGEMPTMARLLGQGAMVPMNSVLPTVSCVAWTSIMTGKNPARHGIFGFVERQPASYNIYVNTSAHVRTTTLWDAVAQAGRRSVVINVPNTYPPKPTNGVLISGFETPDLKKGVTPASQVERLQRLGYRIDIDAWAARKSKDAFLDDLRLTFERRTATFLELLEQEAWDLFVGVYMETDRLHHFLWEHMERDHPTYAPAFLDFYHRIDAAIGEIVKRLDDRTVLMILSDHGFCTLRQEVYVNRWLEERGWLRFTKETPESLEDMAAESRAYSLDPGRFYLNLRGREPRGTVEPEAYEEVRRRLAAELAEMIDPQTNEPVVTRIYRREELYSGPLLAQAPDLVMLTRDGYEAKGAVNKKVVYGRTEIEGMHTTDNAMLYLRDVRLARPQAEVTDVLPTVLAIMGIPAPEEGDGAALGAA